MNSLQQDDLLRTLLELHTFFLLVLLLALLLLSLPLRTLPCGLLHQQAPAFPEAVLIDAIFAQSPALLSSSCVSHNLRTTSLAKGAAAPLSCLFNFPGRGNYQWLYGAQHSPT